MDEAPIDQMVRMITGFWVTQCVAVVARYGVADQLKDGARDVGDIARAVGADEDALFRVMRALAGVGIMRQAGRAFALTPLGETLRRDAPAPVADLAIALAAPGHWLPWGRLDAVVRTGHRMTLNTLGGEIFEYYATHDDESRAFSGAMRGLSLLVADEVAPIAASGTEVVVDIGGGSATLIAAVLVAHPETTGIIVDMPHVVPEARATLAAYDLAERCEVVAGDFFADVPTGDVYLLKQILHDWDDDRCVRLLKNIAGRVNPGGRVLIIELVIPTEGASNAALADVNMLVMLPGRERTLEEYTALLARAGLTFHSVRTTVSTFQIIEARA